MKKLSIRHLIGIILIISNIWCFTGCTADKTSNSTNSKSQQETVTSIRIGKKASKFIEQPVQDVVDYLTELGFNNITTEASDKGETYAENDEVKFARKPNQNRIDFSMKAVIIKLYH